MGGWVPTQGLSWSTHSNHSHGSRNALPKYSRFCIPNPPNCFGLCALFQLTRQCPPLQFSLPFHRKFLLVLSTPFTVHFFSGKTPRSNNLIFHKTYRIMSLKWALRDSVSFHIIIPQSCCITLENHEIKVSIEIGVRPGVEPESSVCGELMHSGELMECDRDGV